MWNLLVKSKNIQWLKNTIYLLKIPKFGLGLRYRLNIYISSKFFLQFDIFLLTKKREIYR